jgi:tripartite-type tricarboxylate transporter receptor subunit TctC
VRADQRNKLTSRSPEIVGNTPQEFNDLLKRDIARRVQVIKDSGFKL